MFSLSQFLRLSDCEWNEAKTTRTKQRTRTGRWRPIVLYCIVFYSLLYFISHFFCQVGDLLIGWLLYKLASLHSQMLVHVIYLMHNQGKLVQLSLKVSMSPLIHLVLFPVFSWKSRCWIWNLISLQSQSCSNRTLWMVFLC